tara:strand:- start:373 stop:546 length:174 start_codon:yes stop_codon:yes gene_type:complete
MSSEKAYSKALINKLVQGGFKQGNQGKFGYDIIKRNGKKIITIHGSMSPKLKHGGKV